MPNDAHMTASLAYRKNEDRILRGDVPEKYLRLLPYIPGNRILEIGSAEGVLALMLAKAGKHVTALERKFVRHQAAIALRDEWLRRGILPAGARTAHVHGDIVPAIKLVEAGAFDTMVAVRMIYYLGGNLDAVFSEVALKVPNVVLCGNKSRAQWWRDGIPNRNDRADNYYASHEGMIDLLTRHGYEIKTVVREGDPIVVGVR